MLTSQSQINPSPQNSIKKTIGDNNRLDSVHGSALIVAHLVKGFRLLPAMTLVSYPDGIEPLLVKSISSVARILNHSHEKVLSVPALKELMHRNGLNTRFLWILLTKVTLKKSRSLLMSAIMIRIMKRYVFSKVALRCRVDSHYVAYKSESLMETISIFVNAILKNKFAKYK